MKACRNALRHAHAGSDDRIGARQMASAVLPIAALWWAMAAAAGVMPWLSVLLALPAGVLLVRAFVLMHDCGHGSLFRSDRWNRICGAALGVLAGMPQPVWARHHDHHHVTNGDWERYRGPLNVMAVQEYQALTHGQRRRYRALRSIWLAPLGGLLYFAVSPRLNWLRATASLARHVLAGWRARPAAGMRAWLLDYHRPYCASIADYGHMLVNNLALFALWAAMCAAMGGALFFICYGLALSIAGGAAIVLFSVQHNFSHSYASPTLGWDRDSAVVHGTSFLVLPRWLNWVTADIGYHHVHHLCAGIPNYRLASCHEREEHRFTGVMRLRLRDLPHALEFILWDVRAQRLVSAVELPA